MFMIAWCEPDYEDGDKSCNVRLANHDYFLA